MKQGYKLTKLFFILAILVCGVIFALSLNDVRITKAETYERHGVYADWFYDVNSPDSAGTENNPYIITSAEALDALSTRICAGNTFSGVYFKIADNEGLPITSMERSEVIGAVDKVFSGIFDGNGCNFILQIAKENTVGLFANIGSSGVIKNLSTSGVMGGTTIVGAIAGSNSGIIENCFNKATVNSSGGICGGIVGENKGVVTGCYNAGSVSGDGQVGGIAGKNAGTISECFNKGTLLSLDRAVIGGITGLLQQPGTVLNCFNVSDISCDVSYVGGIAGRFYSGASIRSCYNIGVITSSGTFVGSLAGGNSSCGIIYSSYYNTTASALGPINRSTTSGAVGLTTIQMIGGLSLFTGFSTEQWTVTDNISMSGANFPQLKKFALSSNSGIKSDSKSCTEIDDIEISSFTSNKTSVDFGESITFTVSATHSLGEAGTFLYKWKRDGKNYLISQTPTLTISNVADSGEFSCQVGYVIEENVVKMNSTSSISVNIRARNLADCTTISEISELFIYDGTPHTPTSFTVRDSSLGCDLVYGIDYSCRYENNIENGVATVIVTGEGNYNGTKTTTFKIGKSERTIEITSDISKTYNGSAVGTPLYLVVGGGTVSFEYYTKEGVKLSSAPINAGEYSVKVVIAESSTHQTANASADFVISRAKISSPTLICSEFTYTGRECTVNVASNEIYDISLNTATNVGNYEAVISLKSTNYEWQNGSREDVKLSWKIVQAMAEITSVSDISKKYDGQPVTNPVCSIIGDGEMSFEFYDHNGVKLDGAPENYGEYSVKVLISDGGNYLGVNTLVDFYISRATVVKPTIIESEFIYDGEEKTATLTTGEHYSIYNDTRANAGSYELTVILLDKVNYEWIGGGQDNLIIPWKINKATYNMSQVSFNGKSFIHDGEKHSIAISGNLPAGVSVEYFGNNISTAGEHIVTAKFRGNSNYNLIEDLQATIIINPTELKTTNSLLSVVSESGFSNACKVSVSTVEQKEIIDNINEALKGIYGKNLKVDTVYEIDLLNEENVYVQPDGTITVRLKLDADLLEKENIEVVYIDDNGKVTDMNARVTEDGYVEFNTNHMSKYAIVTEPANLWWVWIITGVVIGFLGAFVLLFILYKKKQMAKS